MPWFKLNVLRNMAKQMGIYAMLRGRASPGEIILMDEGLVHQAHSLFVHPNHAPRRQELLQFVQEVPPPDLLVLVEGPSSEVLSRTLQRGHPRVPGAPVAEVDTFLKQAHDVFAHLVELAACRVETARIWNGDRSQTEAALGGLVARLTVAHGA
jgi:deoxyadenosine/deoxycytidine kinase